MDRYEHLAGKFIEFARDFQRAAPMYAELARSIAHDDELLALLAEAPEPQQLPVLLFASVHSLVLAEPDLPLAAYYRTASYQSATDAAHRFGEARRDDTFTGVFEEFRDLCNTRRSELSNLLQTRMTQTNEVGRCALYLAGLSLLPPELDSLSLVDVGASAGLNLFLDRFHYTFVPEHEVGPVSQVHVTCELRGELRPTHLQVPTITGRLGIDRSPIDLHDVEDRNWLRACVWPEQRERCRRLDAAIDIALSAPAEIRRGDATAELDEAVTTAGRSGHPVVMNSWVLNYLSETERRAYVAELERLGTRGDVSWVFAESPRFCPDLPFPSGLERPDLTLLMLVTWRRGVREVRHVANCHPHGAWLQWLDDPVSWG